MKIHELRTFLNQIPSSYDNLEVWIDTLANAGGRPVEIISIKPANQCCLDYDEDVPYIDPDEIDAEPHSVEFTAKQIELEKLGYVWNGFSFYQNILAIEF